MTYRVLCIHHHPAASFVLSSSSPFCQAAPCPWQFHMHLFAKSLTVSACHQVLASRSSCVDLSSHSHFSIFYCSSQGRARSSPTQPRSQLALNPPEANLVKPSIFPFHVPVIAKARATPRKIPTKQYQETGSTGCPESLYCSPTDSLQMLYLAAKSMEA
ncbi:hypothetical protein LIA77_09237 [Sarocladium implicatum]|nr:hypothetical protein LIA77_09237 [Sarocladium implicatum]